MPPSDQGSLELHAFGPHIASCWSQRAASRLGCALFQTIANDVEGRSPIKPRRDRAAHIIDVRDIRPNYSSRRASHNWGFCADAAAQRPKHAARGARIVRGRTTCPAGAVLAGFSSDGSGLLHQHEGRRCGRGSDIGRGSLSFRFVTPSQQDDARWR
jgi:hypothetical protein